MNQSQSNKTKALIFFKVATSAFEQQRALKTNKAPLWCCGAALLPAEGALSFDQFCNLYPQFFVQPV